MGVDEIDIMLVMKIGNVSNSILVLDDGQPKVSSWLTIEVPAMSELGPVYLCD